MLGPAICGACYEVPAQMRDEVADALPGSASTTDRGTPGLDLRAGLARQLRAAGVAEVVIDPRCTYTDPEPVQPSRGRADRSVRRADLDAELIMNRGPDGARENLVPDPVLHPVCRAAIASRRR